MQTTSVKPYFNNSDYIRYREILRNERFPLAFVDLEKLDSNIRYVASTQQSTGKTVRVGTKSIRCVELTRRIFSRGGNAYKGILGFTMEEAEFLVREGFDDIIVAYPTVQKTDIDIFVKLTKAKKRITLMIDSEDHLRILSQAGDSARVTLSCCLEVDMYILPYLPFEIPVTVLAVSITLLFLFLLIIGMKLAISLQMIMVVQLVIALLLYGIFGALHSGINFSLHLTQGAGGLVMATILCYSVCMGFQVIAKMGEEMVDAKRNIPRSLLIGGSIVLVIYIVVGTVFVSSVPYDFEMVKGMKAPLLDMGSRFLSPFWVAFLSIGALSAGLTSLNAGAIALPRELFSQARDGVSPFLLGRINTRTRTPLNAVMVYFLFTIVLILLGQSIDFYGVMTAVGILLMTAIIAVATVRLPGRFPEQYQQSYFKLSRLWLYLVAIISVISSLFFVALVLKEMPIVGAIYLGWILFVVVYYFLRIRWLKYKGYDWEGAICTIPGYDE